MDIRNHVFVVTGGASGLGAATAAMLLTGRKVVLRIMSVFQGIVVAFLLAAMTLYALSIPMVMKAVPAAMQGQLQISIVKAMVTGSAPKTADLRHVSEQEIRLRRHRVHTEAREARPNEVYPLAVSTLNPPTPVRRSTTDCCVPWSVIWKI